MATSLLTPTDMTLGGSKLPELAFSLDDPAFQSDHFRWAAQSRFQGAFRSCIRRKQPPKGWPVHMTGARTCSSPAAAPRALKTSTCSCSVVYGAWARSAARGGQSRTSVMCPLASKRGLPRLRWTQQRPDIMEEWGARPRTDPHRSMSSRRRRRRRRERALPALRPLPSLGTACTLAGPSSHQFVFLFTCCGAGCTTSK